MNMMLRGVALCLISMVLAGCNAVGTCEDGSGGMRLGGDSVAKRLLAKGVTEYQSGNYVSAKSSLQGVLQNQYATKDERASANKYLAFMACVSGEQRQCADHFRKSLSIKSDFELSDAEAGHPLWGPVFRNIKGEKAK